MSHVRRQRATKPGRAAFTIVEAVIVVFIIGVISAIALPRYAGLVARQRLEGAARRIIADLSYAQRHARLTSVELTVHFDAGAEYYELVGMTDPDRPGQPYRVALDKEPYCAFITTVTLDPGNDIRFDGYGHPNSGGTIVIKAGSSQKTITIDPDTGRATSSIPEAVPPPELPQPPEQT